MEQEFRMERKKVTESLKGYKLDRYLTTYYLLVTASASSTE